MKTIKILHFHFDIFNTRLLRTFVAHVHFVLLFSSFSLFYYFYMHDGDLSLNNRHKMKKQYKKGKNLGLCKKTGNRVPMYKVSSDLYRTPSNNSTCLHWSCCLIWCCKYPILMKYPGDLWILTYMGAYWNGLERVFWIF